MGRILMDEPIRPGEGMVDHAGYLIGVFDNQKKLRSGTAQTVNYALHQGKVITLIPVSYTHLDVYKRQCLVCSAL